jgi:hypothetical protein
MAFGSVSMDDAACDIFEELLSEVLATAFAAIHAVSAGRSKGVSAEHLAKVWCIPHDDAARTLGVTTQSLYHDPDSSRTWILTRMKMKPCLFSLMLT